jgi:alcohol dehydrogenase
MRAVRYDAAGGEPRVIDVPAPSCPRDGVIIDVEATGVCRSDWHAWRGHEPVALPHIGGHEFAGVVTAVGPQVRSWAVGDRVTSPFVNGCGRCPWCRSGQAQVCPDQTQPGFTHPGSFAEQVAVRAADLNLVRLPAEIDPVSAAALGCRFATAFRAVTAHGRVGEGEWVAVFGCGGVGLSAVMIAVALGARVVAVDPSAAARARAVELGAEIAAAAVTQAHPVPASAGGAADEAAAGGGGAGEGAAGGAVAGGSGAGAAGGGGAAGEGAAGGAVGGGTRRHMAHAGAAPGDVAAEAPVDLVEVTGGGVHVGIDALGSAATAEASVRSLRRRGRHVQVGLMLAAAARAPLPWDLVVARELEVYGSHGMAAADYPAMLAMVTDGRLDPRRLVGAVVSLDEVGPALAAMDDPVPRHPGLTIAVPPR